MEVLQVTAIHKFQHSGLCSSGNILKAAAADLNARTQPFLVESPVLQVFYSDISKK
jgi:hypothetical protein